MKDNFIINDELKKLITSDETLTQFFLIALLRHANKVNDPKEDDYYNYNDYLAYKDIIEDDESIKKPLLSAFNDLLSNDLINNVYKDYKKMVKNDAKGIIYSLSRLLYIQDKYKNDEIGHIIDAKIKEWLEYIKNYDEKATSTILNEKKEETSTKEYEKALNQMTASVFYLITPQYNLQIHESKPTISFMDLWNYEAIETKDIYKNLKEYLIGVVNDSKSYSLYNEKINGFINDIEDSINMDHFTTKNKETIKVIKSKHKIKDSKDNIGNNAINLEDLANPFISELAGLYGTWCENNGFNIQTNEDVKNWRDKADKYIQHIENFKINKDEISFFTTDYVLNHLAYNEYQINTYKLNLEDELTTIKARTEEKEKDKKLLITTSKQLRAIDNIRGGLVTYTETNTQAIRNKIKAKEQVLKSSHIKQDRDKAKSEIKQLNLELAIAEKKEKDLKDEYANVNEYLNSIYRSMVDTPKSSEYYKDLKKQKREQEKRKEELERIIKFSGWQLDFEGKGSYELILNSKKDSLKLTIENLSKQIAQYTKEEQDLFDFLIHKHLNNTDITTIKFTLREYEKIKNRVRPANNLLNDIQAIHLLFREVWTYTTHDSKSYSFTEKHLFDNLTIKGRIESDINKLDDANLDTEISLEPTETLKQLLKVYDNYQYIRIPMEALQLNNDNEYLAKRLLKHLYRKARTESKDIITPTLKEIIEELQNYGLKHYEMLNRKKTFTTEIVENLDRALTILEGNNRAKKQFIEVLDREPFIIYDNDFRGKSQQKSINEWVKLKLKIKVFDLDIAKLKETKTKRTKKKATKK